MEIGSIIPRENQKLQDAKIELLGEIEKNNESEAKVQEELKLAK